MNGTKIMSIKPPIIPAPTFIKALAKYDFKIGEFPFEKGKIYMFEWLNPEAVPDFLGKQVDYRIKIQEIIVVYREQTLHLTKKQFDFYL